MSSIDSGSEETLFVTALAMPETARAAYLEQACGNDAVLRNAVEKLLRAHLAADRLVLSVSEISRPGALPPSRVDEQSGDWIGRYRLLQKIGEGGCGVVYMAEQEEPIRRRVALKVIKLGMDTKAVIARFDAERQALAMMDHPNIAKVLDAGTTESGRPYFVMELVRGIPVTKYCDEQGLPTEQRLELFCRICYAIQHAHQKGVIHRDIKPSNILVTLHDGVPVPKVIDFGIAKATQGKLTDHTLFTAFEQFIGTPAYMSPEQAELSALDIDTRSDVYSLGVLLYELLTGRTPFDPRTLLSSGLDEIRRVIREVDPPKPSTRLSTLAEADRTSVAKLRATAPAQLSTVLAGDLDWIVMRCLEKDRGRRYETAAALVADVHRHLANEPVMARPPSSAYRMRKFYRRYKAGVIAVIGVTGALAAGLIVSATMWVGERTQRQRATAAEQAAGRAQHEAETARASEEKRATRTALDLANRNLADGHIADGLAYLVYAARKDPSNRTFGPRIASVLASHNFLIPQAAPLKCESPILTVRFAEDGRSFFVGTEDGIFRVMDAATGELKRQFQTAGRVVAGGWQFAALSDSLVGARFVDNQFAVYDVATGTLKFPPIQLDARVGLAESTQAAGLSPRGRWIYAVAELPSRLWLWDAETGALRFEREFERMAGVDINPAEDTLAAIFGPVKQSLERQGQIKRFALPDGAEIGNPISFRPTSRVPFGAQLRFSPDGRRLAFTEFTSAQVFDAATGALLGTLAKGDAELLPGLTTFVTNDRVFVRSQASAGWWDLAEDRFSPLTGAQAFALSLNAERKHAAASSTDGLLRVFDVERNTQVVEPVWRQDRFYCTAVSPDGEQVLMGNADGRLFRFRPGRGAARPLALPATKEPLVPATFLPELPLRLLLPSGGDRAKVIDVASGREAGREIRFPERIREEIPVTDTNPSIRPDAAFMVVWTANGWQSWELGPEGIKAVPLQGTRDDVAIATFSPTRDLVAVTTLGLSRVWDLRTGKTVGQPFDGPVGVWASFSPDGRQLATGNPYGFAQVFDIQSGRRLRNLKIREQTRVWTTEFSPDGTRLLIVNQFGECQLWNATTGQPAGPLLTEVSPIPRFHRAIFAPDGRWAAVPFTKGVILMDGRDGNEAARIRIDGNGKVVAFSPDSTRLGTAEIGGSARVWHVPSGEPITEPMRRPGEGSLPAFSPDGRFLKTENTHVNIWAVPPPLPEGAAQPEWLLSLATLLAGQVVNDAGQLVPALDTVNRVEALRREIAALPSDAPLANWARWVLDSSSHRPIAPGFTVTPDEADRLAVGAPGPK